jgi:hypothetical protein
MAVYVTLRSGKKLKYNDGGRITVKDNTFVISPEEGGYLIARIPLDVVERAEFSAPCRIDWEAIKKPRKAKRKVRK